MKRTLSLVALAAALAVLSGCIDTTTTITVKPDGSGTIEKTIVLSRHLAELMINMGSKGDADSIEKGMLNEDTLKAGAARMGTGVAFVSAQRIKADKGNGWKALYAFKDIGVVKISQNPASDLTVPGASKAATIAADKESFSFTFVRGSPATLTVGFPMPDKGAQPVGGPPAGAAGAAGNEKLMQSMRQLYADMRIVLVVAVDGTIAQTNASYVSGSAVTLIDMDFAKILADDAVFKKLTGAQSQSMAEVRGTVKSVPGVKVETQDPVSIRFK